MWIFVGKIDFFSRICGRWQVNKNIWMMARTAVSGVGSLQPQHFPCQSTTLIISLSSDKTKDHNKIHVIPKKVATEFCWQCWEIPFFGQSGPTSPR